ncbi:MAG: response regulator [Cellvibrionaceae bacterium]
MSSMPIEVLLVEDNPGDIELTREALSAGKLINNIHVVEDGEEALDFLYQEKQYVNVSRPDLILLDLNLPKLNGREVLAKIKSNPELSSIPVVILSSSEDADDIEKAYSLSANSFVTKPVRVNDFVRVAQTLEDFWIGIVKLPSLKNS